MAESELASKFAPFIGMVSVPAAGDLALSLVLFLPPPPPSLRDTARARH